MKKRILSFLIGAALVPAVKAQDYATDSINKQKFTGIYSTGEMSNTFLLPYFSSTKTGKGNFIIKEIDTESLLERNTTSLELPSGYQLKTIGRNNVGFLGVFIDAAKKEEVLVTVVQDNIQAKKSSKITGRTFRAISSDGEGYLLASVEKNGDYTIEEFDSDLVSKWKKIYTAPKGITYTVWDIDIKEGNIEVVRKESNADGKYLFSVQRLIRNDGTEQAVVNIKTDSLSPYPSSISAKQGMLVSGGYYYKNGIYNPMPDGVYATVQQSHDGAVIKVVHAPYSQIIEDVKERLGNKLNDPNTTIVFKAIATENPDESIFITGQVITRKLTDKGATVVMGDFVTVGFGSENKYLGAVVTKNKGLTINLSGELTKTNMADLGLWMDMSGLLQLRSYVFIPGSYPVAAYMEKTDAGNGNLCYTNVFKENPEKNPMCMSTIDSDIKDSATYSFTGLDIPAVANVEYRIIDHSRDFSRYFAYFFRGSVFMMQGRRVLDIKSLEVPLTRPSVESKRQEQEASK